MNPLVFLGATPAYASISENFVGPMGGLLMAAIAFSIVFLVIVGLMLIMKGTKLLANVIDSAKANKSAPSSVPVTKTPAAAPVITVAATPVAGDDEELIAVITAAIAASTGRAVRVTGVRPSAAGGTSAWKVSGRIDNMEGFGCC